MMTQPQATALPTMDVADKALAARDVQPRMLSDACMKRENSQLTQHPTT